MAPQAPPLTYDDTVYAVHGYLRMRDVPVRDSQLYAALQAAGHQPHLISLALSALTAGGTVVENDGWLSRGEVDRSLP